MSNVTDHRGSVPEQSFSIAPARSAHDIAAVAALLREYASTLDIDLAYQGFDDELAGLPGAYRPPSGELLLARDAEGLSLGCVGLRALATEGCCEMKRLYVAPRARGLGLGRALIENIMAEATRLGYREMRLDTLPTMTAAIGMYRVAGFLSIAPYYAPAPEGTLVMARPLGDILRR
jgi:ribosomal protein S18 acetylase RimI-like enzyme